MRQQPKPHEIFTHFKGNKYQIVTLAEHSETGEMLVVYQAMYGEFKTYVRPLESFMSDVDHAKYPEVKQRYRFARNEELDVTVDVHMEATSEQDEKKAANFESKEATERESDVAETEPASNWKLDPMVEKYLDARSVQERIEILVALHDRLTDSMINTMAIATDVEIDEGPIEQRYADLKYCLQTKEKYEKSRRGV